MPPSSPARSRQIHRVLAGPGSGKTRMLTQELQAQRTAGLPLDALIGITFTRRAADELRHRLRTAASDIQSPWVGTFHALARRIQADLYQLPEEIDLDTLISDATALLTRGATLPWLLRLRFIGVDEAQDLDQSQVDFLNALLVASAGAELFLVGDPDQAIYGFRRASAQFLLHPSRYFSGPVRTITLSDNHRSAQQIVAMAQAILSGAADPDSPCRSLKAIRPEAHPAVREVIGSSPQDEARLIFQEIRTLLAVGVPADQQAILARTRAQFAPLQAEAARWGLALYTPPTDDRIGTTTPQPPQPAVTLLTIHQSKGLEWTVVYLAGCQAGLIPHSAATSAREHDEERRLLYVAITRTKQLLWLCRYGTRSTYLPTSPAARPASASRTATTPSLWSCVARWFVRR